jgi:hypothetical protein
MTGFDPRAFDDLDPSQEEMLDLLQVMDEVDAEEAGGAGPGAGDGPDLAGDGDDYGPWDDQLGALGEIGDQLDVHHATADAVAAEDMADSVFFTTRPTDEAKAENAVARIEAGTYTEPAYFRPARDGQGRFGRVCGPVDEVLGTCGSRYHAQGCSAVVMQAAATGTPEEIIAWRDTLARHTPPPGAAGAATQMGLASEPVPGEGADTWQSLLEGPARPYGEIHARMLAEMALADNPAPPPREGPDVSGLARELGLK